LRHFLDFLPAGCACVAVLVVLLPTSDRLLHWFVLPVTLCGVLVAVDALDWLRGRFDRFDLRGLIGLLGCYFFFLAPLLHVSRDYYMAEVTPPPDWRPWLGQMAVLNALGLLVYRLVLGFQPGSTDQGPGTRPAWVLKERWFFALVAIALPISALLQVWVYVQFGGIAGYIEATTEQVFRNNMPGMGFTFMFSESFPILALMAFAVCARRRPRCRSWPVLLAALVVFFALMMFFGGLRSNRSNVVWNLFWAVAIVHFCLRPMPRWLIGVGVLFLMLFMWVFALYKAAGLSTVDAFTDWEAQEVLARKSNRTLDSVLLGDFGRSDVQAFLVYRLASPQSDFEYGLGRTYLGGLAIVIPKSLWPDRPPAAGREGTEAQLGRGSFDPPWTESPRVYGLAGEAMLNFGPLAVPFAFIPWSLFVAWVRRPLTTWHRADPRFLLYPLLVVLAFAALFQDAENLVFFLFKFGTVPFLVTVPALRPPPVCRSSP
jgi:hypothetical protein